MNTTTNPSTRTPATKQVGILIATIAALFAVLIAMAPTAAAEPADEIQILDLDDWDPGLPEPPEHEILLIDPEILVNTTSVGMNEDRSPVPADSLREGMVVLDAVYAPEETTLLRDAAARGARPVGGKWMLVHQAVEQVHRWTGRRPDAAILAEAFDAAG